MVPAQLRKLASTALTGSFLAIAGLACVSMIGGSDAAYAKSENGNGGGNGGGKGGDQGNRGSDASGPGKSDQASSRDSRDRSERSRASRQDRDRTRDRSERGPKFLRDLREAFRGPRQRDSAATSTKQTAQRAPRRTERSTPEVKASPRPSVKPSTVSRGALASELKGLNAAHANPNAFANASPDSQVGRIATYRDAVLESETAAEDLADAKARQEELLAAQDGRSIDEIDADIAALDPENPDNADALAELEAERADAELARDELDEIEQEIAELEATVDEAETAQKDALDAASGGRDLSPEAMAELHELLGLDAPATDETADLDEAGDELQTETEAELSEDDTGLETVDDDPVQG